ncbi:hypothetical protein H0H93_014051 [Arthromyces matolae]|nr:hypothetical protein H0H93_014051 [Arthromyces matolae]
MNFHCARKHVVVPILQSCRSNATRYCKLQLNARYVSKSVVEHLLPRKTTVSQLYSLLDSPKKKFDQDLPSELVELVKARKFYAADQLRIQLVKDGIQLRSHPVFLKAAIASLRRGDTENFESWFSLIPERTFHGSQHLLFSTESNSFPEICRILFASPSEYVTTILRFAILSARKGYLQPILNQTLPLLARFTPAELGIAWLREMELAFTMYLSRFASPSTLPNIANHFYNLSVKVCCSAGWVSQAEILLKSKQPLSSETRALLSRLLPNFGPSRSEHPVQATRPHDHQKVVHCPAASASAESSGLSPSYLSRQRLLTQLRHLDSQLCRRNIIVAPDVTAFISCFQEFGAAHDTLSQLRYQALLAGCPVSTSWLEGELKFYSNDRQWENILKLHLTYFNSTPELPGPFKDALKTIADFRQITTVPIARIKLTSTSRRIVLKAIIRLTCTLPDPLMTLEALYKSFQEEMATNFYDVYELQPAFVLSFGDCDAPHDAVRVFKDSGDSPPLKTVETLAEVLACAKRVDKAIALLKSIELGQMKVMLYNGKVDRVGAGPSTYERVINGFVKAGLLEPALEVEAMMLKKCPYSSSKRPGVIASLRALESGVNDVRAI